jgi:hypothetical protein
LDSSACFRVLFCWQLLHQAAPVAMFQPANEDLLWLCSTGKLIRGGSQTSKSFTGDRHLNESIFPTTHGTRASAMASSTRFLHFHYALYFLRFEPFSNPDPSLKFRSPSCRYSHHFHIPSIRIAFVLLLSAMQHVQCQHILDHLSIFYREVEVDALMCGNVLYTKRKDTRGDRALIRRTIQLYHTQLWATKYCG